MRSKKKRRIVREELTTHHAEESSSLRLIRKRPLAKELKISPWTLMRWVQAGDFPAPIKLSDVVLAWRVEDVEQWLASRQEAAE